MQIAFRNITLDQLNHQFNRHFSHLRNELVDGRQGRLEIRGFSQVIKADHRTISGILNRLQSSLAGTTADISWEAKTAVGGLLGKSFDADVSCLGRSNRNLDRARRPRDSTAGAILITLQAVAGTDQLSLPVMADAVPLARQIAHSSQSPSQFARIPGNQDFRCWSIVYRGVGGKLVAAP
jgi:hypothetical protein